MVRYTATIIGNDGYRIQLANQPIDVFLDILNELKAKNELADLKLEKETSKVKEMKKGSKVLIDKDELLTKLSKGSKK
tara:strand:- start:559 stop:792 length:234 start_codon:yes stop_codon:yes gene_type:complete